MNRSELIAALAEKTGVTKAFAKLNLDAMLDIVTEQLAEGNSVSLVGFGTFEVRDRPGRTGRNPATGAAISIPASRAPAFKPGATLKKEVNV